MKDIFVAKTLEEAKAQAAKAFGVEENKIAFEVLEESKGILGIGKKVKVSASYEEKSTANVKPAVKKEDKPVEAAVKSVVSNNEKSKIALEYIETIIKAMDLDCSVAIKEENEEGAVIEISGNEVGTVIGRRGETLDAIQYLASMIANRNDKEYYRITVDSNGYRDKRKETLEELAVKIANNVQKTGRTSTLEPMNPYERRIIHSAISDIKGVTSRSVGEEPYRKVVISSTEKKNDRNYSDRRRNNRRGKNTPPRSLDLTTSFEKDYVKPAPRPKPEDEMDLELYGKIEVKNAGAGNFDD